MRIANRSAGLVPMVAVALLVIAPAVEARTTPEQICRSGKNRTAGKYAACRANAEAKRVTTGDASKFAVALEQCAEKFARAWQKLEEKADEKGAPCPADDVVIRNLTDAYTNGVAEEAGGNPAIPPLCQASPFPNTGLTEAPGSGGCPSGMAFVESFCIDLFEASLVVVRDDGSTAPWSPYLNPGTTRVRALSLRNAVPQGYVNGLQAGLACAEAGKRLCTDAEWLRACRGPAGTTYPYGDTSQPGVCNDARNVHPAVEFFGTSDPWVFEEIGNACLNQLPETLDRTGSQTGCVTTEGIFDMMGNLNEWTANPAGTLRGGSYVDTTINGPGCLNSVTAHDSTHSDYSTGFRCCS